jgi:hypothetical protein
LAKCRRENLPNINISCQVRVHGQAHSERSQ